MIKKLYIFFFIFLIFCNKSFAKSGEGELKLSKYTMEIVMMYMYGAGNTKYSGDGKSKHDPMGGEDGIYYLFPPDAGVYFFMVEFGHTRRESEFLVNIT